MNSYDEQTKKDTKILKIENFTTAVSDFERTSRQKFTRR